MKKRCDDRKNHAYKFYGGKGISYPKSWKSFENFLNDMGEKPEEKSLDRIDNNKGYSKQNCRWATMAEQNRNRSNTVLYRGECAKDASLRLGGTDNLVQKRIKAMGWSIHDAFNTPAQKYTRSVK